MENALIDLSHFRGAQLVDTLMDNAEEQRMLVMISQLQAKLTVDGNQYCYTYGEWPNDCVVGFGNTPRLAMVEFCRNFATQTIKAPPDKTPNLPGFEQSMKDLNDLNIRP